MDRLFGKKVSFWDVVFLFLKNFWIRPPGSGTPGLQVDSGQVKKKFKIEQNLLNKSWYFMDGMN